ncbi:MAG: PulJ/GspJ family protein [Planctomycetota bacterium]|jgi:type II secretory pathway component PulJ
MRSQRGQTLLELLVYLGIASVGISIGLSLYGAERLTSREQHETFRRSAAASAVLHELAEDLRRAVRVAPRGEGPGVLVFWEDGTVAAWFDRSSRPGEIHRKVFRNSLPESDRVVARGVDALGVEVTGQLATARIAAGDEERTITVRMRHARP